MRGHGLGKELLRVILAHPELSTVTHWTLVTGDAYGLYEKFGFRAGEIDKKWMTMVMPRIRNIVANSTMSPIGLSPKEG
jgi:hypothetical protein